MGPTTEAGPEERTGPSFLLLGHVLRPHGLHGELRVRLLTDYPERIGDLPQIYLATDLEARDVQVWRVEHMRMHRQFGLLKLHGVNDRNAAELLRELKVLVAIDDAVPLEEDEFYLYQLIGLRVITEEGCELGTIQDIIETGANDVYIVKGPGSGEILIPATAETILETRIADGYLRVQLPDGLLSD
ncbi:MAG: ribosome maturation factor RimM [Anaerolineaceae bacterium]|nr:ribosome maturation factor RimM [Anaerolineaceae bacterium]MDE0329825.1 ribosome maturation factor RimM [Anaerolineaceae bacterium]